MRDTSGMSQSAAEAIANIRAGNTEYQRKREFNRKLGMAGVQAALAGARGVIGNLASRNLEEEQAAAAKKKAVDLAIKNAKTPPNHPDDTPRDEYGLPIDRPSYASAMDGAVMNGTPDRKLLLDGPSSKMSVQDMARAGQAQTDANDAAADAPIAGRWTDEGFSKADMNASVNASDIDRAKAMMKQPSLGFGGLGNSFNGGGQ